MKQKLKIWGICAALIVAVTLINRWTAPKPEAIVQQTENEPETSSKPAVQYDYSKKSGYMVYYSTLTQDIIDTMKRYEVVIIHPKMGNITRDQVQEIRATGTIVLGYIAIGEDLRTAGLTPEQMLQDPRFVEDGSGPKVDPRKAGVASLDGIDVNGKPSPGGTGYASYYLDDNDFDGLPDINVNFHCAFTNIGDPNWFKVLDNMTIDGTDQVPGLKEILTDDYGRGLGCDGVFLDTIDTAAPNAFTADTDDFRTRYEWTSVGVREFCKSLKEAYPDKQILQNRGLFFYNPQLPMYKYNPREYVDYLYYESYRLDSNTNVLYYDTYFHDNKYNYLPRIAAEASRPDGFQVLSLGYAEGPAEYELGATLVGKSKVGLDILLEDIYEAQDVAGFKHYLTDAGLTVVNSFVIDYEDKTDDAAPVWTSVYNDKNAWPPEEPTPRVGVSQAEANKDGSVTVRWDVALDKNKVSYTLYYQTEKFDFEADPDLTAATQVELVPEVGKGYENGIGPDVYPFEATIEELEHKTTYYFVIRAKDNSDKHNEEKNEVVLSVKTK